MSQQLPHRVSGFLSQFSGLGLAVLLVSCAGAPSQNQASAPSPSNSVAPSASSQTAKSQAFPNPVVSPTAIVQVPAVPGLLQPTNGRVRANSVTTGRSDPFAAVATAPVSLAAASTTTSKRPQSVTVPGKQTPFALTPLPLGPANSPNLTPLPPVNSTALPPSLPVAPVSRTAAADAIEISGAVQVKGKWHVIVKEPNADTSRYVVPGDYLANGSVLVKKIIAGADPVVILQQNGIEVTRSIGSGKGSIASR